jgi:hypothetical protein
MCQTFQVSTKIIICAILFCSTNPLPTFTRYLQTDKLLQLLSDSESMKFSFLSFDPFPLPLDPDIKIKGIIPEKAILFKVSIRFKTAQLC